MRIINYKRKTTIKRFINYNCSWSFELFPDEKLYLLLKNLLFCSINQPLYINSVII
jgi:hypothetical protein